jgi:NlpC/P60 family
VLVHNCSGLIYWAGLQCGVVLPRSTQAEWTQLPHSTAWALAPVGSIVEFAVPSDGGAPPQHVGVVVGGGYMIDDPYTGAVVRQERIPYQPGEIWPIGYCALPFVGAPGPPKPPPTPSPSPTPTQEDNVICYDPGNANGGWALAPDGGVDNYGPSPYLGSMAGNRWNWTAVGKQAGIAPWWDGSGWGFVVALNCGPGKGEGGGDFDYYRFPSNGSLKDPKAERYEITNPKATAAAEAEQT